MSTPSSASSERSCRAARPAGSQGNIELHGQSGASRLAAEASLSDASWLVPGQRILFAGWSGHIRLTDDDLSLTNLGGTVNGGTIRIDGQLPLQAQGAGGGLTIAARDILIDVPRGLHSQLGADLVWRQSEAAATLQGKVEITANRYTEPVTRILQLVNSLASATRSSGESSLPPWLARTALEISLAVTDPILIDNSVGTVELMPDLRLGGTVDSPSLSGRIDVVDDGRVQLGGRAYRLRDSLLRFAPADGLVPTLDVFGDTRIGDYDVTIRISGTPDRIETAFSSVPPLGERELQSLIVTGRADDQSTQGKQSDNFAAAAAATDILGFAGKFVGLDSVRIGAADLDLVSKDVSTAQHLTVSEVARLVVRPDLFRQPRRWLGHVGARVEADPAQRDPSLVGRGRHADARISPVPRVRPRLARRSRRGPPFGGGAAACDRGRGSDYGHTGIHRRGGLRPARA